MWFALKDRYEFAILKDGVLILADFKLSKITTFAQHKINTGCLVVTAFKVRLKRFLKSHDRLMSSVEEAVSCHISTAVPTWTLARLNHPSSQTSVRPPPRRACTVAFVYTRSPASAGNVYPAEVQLGCALAQLYSTGCEGSQLGYIY